MHARSPTGWALLLMAGLGALPAAAAGKAGPEAVPSRVDAEARRRSRVAELVKQETPVPSLTVLRDDDTPIPFRTDAAASEVVLYRVHEGGLYREGTGDVVQVVLGRPSEWLVLVDATSGRRFRLAGFAQGNDFNAWIRTHHRDIDRTDAEHVADGYVTLAYASDCATVTRFYEVRRYVEDALFDAGLDDVRIAGTARRWLQPRRAAIEETLARRGIMSVDGGYRATRLVMHRARGGSLPIVELHELNLAVGRRGEVEVSGDRVDAVFDLGAADR
ncbi:MAG: hypothetical protein ACE5IK_10000 [Acidobacteriota bacterium]